MRWGEFGLIDGGAILNSLAASFTLAMGNSRLELAGDACGIAHVSVRLALTPPSPRGRLQVVSVTL